ncbi:HNH endonuclease [Brachybacterium sacelli]|uniref:HNH nuclease domain-containing protein n=1 Tax=Brachybacterium sacelli TaxID=173364 RepID=A0ABS4X3Q9_9MICO|nr:HNH endonuclease signature motif containing protein [Brachybacterium sacelli]MBP2383104.1 hypothetical protein [Brachybacterium sacelli]
MLMSTPPPVPDEEPAASSSRLRALRDGGPGAVAEMIDEAGALLAAIATEPENMFEVSGRDRAAYAQLLTGIQRSRSLIDALETRAVVALDDATRRDRLSASRDAAGHEVDEQPLDQIAESAHRIASRDLSLLSRRAPADAGRTVTSARRLVESMPHLLTAMISGKAAANSLYAAADATSVLDAEQRAAVDALLHERLPSLDGAGTRKWKAAVAAAIGELDPDGEAIRHRRSRGKRHLSLTQGDHGMATFTAYMPAADAKLVHKRLSLEAERRRSNGARTGHSVLMVDALTDTVLGRKEGMDPVQIDLGVMITDRALFHPGVGDVAHIEGYGPVPAEAVRDQLRAITAEPADGQRDPFEGDGPAIRAVIRRLYTHPTTGELVQMDSRARAFPPAMARFLSWRDGSCRGPFCNASTRQRDHIVPHGLGGSTSLDNGQDTCAHCNQKELDTLSVERLDDPAHPGHQVAWTGFAGTTRITSPSPLVRPTGGAETVEQARNGIGRHGSPEGPRGRPSGVGRRRVPPEDTSSSGP